MQGKIDQARPSQSGKTLGVFIDGTWYQTKHFELQNHIGETITFQSSISEYNGKPMHWLNDYTVAGASTTPADAAFDAAHAQHRGETAPKRDRDASIIAQALTKACTAAGDDVATVWTRYQAFYDLAQGKPMSLPESKVAPGKNFGDDFDDEIPF